MLFILQNRLYNNDLISCLCKNKIHNFVNPDGSSCIPKSGDFKNNEEDDVAYGPDLNYNYEGHF